MSEVLEKAKQRLTLIEDEARRLRDFIQTYESIAASEAVTLGDSLSAEIIRGGHTDPDRPQDRPKRIVKVAKDAIREKGRPMTRSQLVKALEEQGLVIGGADKRKNMGTILWRSGQFENVEGAGYWPKDAPPWGAKEFDL